MRDFTLIFALAALGAMALIAPGCDDPVSSYKPRIVNQTDVFHLILEDAQEVDTTAYYYWRNDGSSANIDQLADIKQGQVTIYIEDPDKFRVYSTDMRQNGSFVTQAGVPGVWRIRVALTDFSGLFDFRAQRR